MLKLDLKTNWFQQQTVLLGYSYLIQLCLSELQSLKMLDKEYIFQIF